MSSDLNAELRYRLVGFIAPVGPPSFVIPAFDLFDPQRPVVRGELSRSSLLIQDVCDGFKTTFVACEVDNLTLIYSRDKRLLPYEYYESLYYGNEFPNDLVGKGERLYAYAFSDFDFAVGHSDVLVPILKTFLRRKRDEIPRFRRLELARFVKDVTEIEQAIVDCSNAVSAKNSEIGSMYQKLARIPIRRGETE